MSIALQKRIDCPGPDDVEDVSEHGRIAAMTGIQPDGPHAFVMRARRIDNDPAWARALVVKVTNANAAP